MDDETKTARAVRLMRAGDVRGALKIVKGFRLGLSVDERRVFGQGYEAVERPEFYRQLGKDPAALIAAARKLFGKVFKT